VNNDDLGGGGKGIRFREFIRGIIHFNPTFICCQIHGHSILKLTRNIMEDNVNDVYNMPVVVLNINVLVTYELNPHKIF